MAESLAPLSFPADGEQAFHHALKQAAHAYLADDHRYASIRQKVTALLLTLLCGGFYASSLMQHNAWAFVGCYFMFVLTGMLLNVMVFHDAAHNAFFRAAWANRLVGRLMTLPLGIDPDYWRVRHVQFHHAYANVEHYDLDTEENGVLRQTPFQGWRKHMRYQHLYWPMVAALSLPYISWIFDWSDRLRKTPLKAKSILPGNKGWAVFLASKACHLLLVLIVPLVIFEGSWTTVLIAYFLSQMLASLWVVFLLLGTHWAEAEFYQPSDSPLMPHGWYRHNFATTCDWQTSPRWLHHAVGGLNFHLTHHLFPGWSHRHYPALANIIADLAPRHGLHYRCIDYRELLRQQRKFLRSMGRDAQVTNIT
ncbi:fatty acid desaturase family protein [Pseudomonas syringae]|uniref:fatty acid desaturase family protein n=1 Tax=Pseudomonas TaxID=286 RepID=UPI000CD26FEB|nr:acyl-CoA desaturase [Pseudomonas syringae]MCF5031307.1 acyl-CoA desaturase [Pseudomonas syringae]POD16294.1 acyl-CoA desaturase [Pseudomonas syringae pv. syringae]UQB20071.1 acyl-CoA desaturase [Pseudomonas syringae pv. syringae]